MTNYIPFKHLEFDTDLSVEEILQIIRKSVKVFQWSPPRYSNDWSFAGRIEKNRFLIGRMWGGNGLAVIAYTTLAETAAGTHVRINILYHPIFYLFVPTIMIIPSFLWWLFTRILSADVFSYSFIVIPAWCLFVYIAILRYFDSESNKLEAFLLPLLSSTKAK